MTRCASRTGYAAHNLAVLKHITMNLIRLDPVPVKAASRSDGSSPLLPTTIALISSVLYKIRAIALGRGQAPPHRRSHVGVKSAPRRPGASPS